MKVLFDIVKIVIQTLSVLLGVAFFTLLERKILGYIQLRKGPNKPGIRGLFVPLADAAKLLTKEVNRPYQSNVLFRLIPILTLIIPLTLWILYPGEVLIFRYSLLLFVCISSLGVYSLLGAGWRSNRKYTLMGAIRAVAQSISYEVCIIIVLLQIVFYFHYTFYSQKLSPLTFILYRTIILFIIILAESNRSPFDFREGESELVRGFNTEYRSVPFIMIFLAEYISILFLSILICALYFVTSTMDLCITLFWVALFLWCRGTLPRMRYDQLMTLAWMNFLPASLSFLAFLA